MSIREQQIRDMANTIALQADAIALGAAPKASLNARAKLLKNNIETLLAWTESPGFKETTDNNPEFWKDWS